MIIVRTVLPGVEEPPYYREVCGCDHLACQPKDYIILYIKKFVTISIYLRQVLLQPVNLRNLVLTAGDAGCSACYLQEIQNLEWGIAFNLY